MDWTQMCWNPVLSADVLKVDWPIGANPGLREVHLWGMSFEYGVYEFL